MKKRRRCYTKHTWKGKAVLTTWFIARCQDCKKFINTTQHKWCKTCSQKHYLARRRLEEFKFRHSTKGKAYYKKIDHERHNINRLYPTYDKKVEDKL